MRKALSKNEIINLIKAEKSFLKETFGVLNIGLFGSYAKDQQTPDSDIDLLVEFAEPRFDWIAGLNIYMEKKLDKKIEKENSSFLKGHDEINWGNIMRLRDIVSHHYEKVDHEIVFDICKNHLPKLRKTIQKMLN